MNDKELEKWFNPYLIKRSNQIRGMKPNTVYITKTQIQELLES